MIESLKRHWLFLLPLAAFLFYYVFQNVIGFQRYAAGPVTVFCVALFVCIVSYVLTYRFAPVGWADALARKMPRVISGDVAVAVVVACYVLTLVLACANVEHVPFFSALAGASSADLVDYRFAFMRGDTLGGRFVNYAYSILMQSLMPLALAFMYGRCRPLRHWVLAVFIFGTAFSLSKGGFLCIAAPLLATALMMRRIKLALLAFLGFFLSIAIMYVLASGTVGFAYSKLANAYPAAAQWVGGATEGGGVRSEEPQVALQSNVPDRYNVFAERSQLKLIVNRVVWIPYVTALDWFRYQEDRLEGEWVLGKSIRPLAYLMGVEHVNLEKEVAEFQWQVESGATSNAVFFADAWLNWGWFGVVLYAALFSLTIKLIVTSRCLPIIAASSFPVWVACSSALPPVYFSAGLGILLFLSLVVREKQGADQSGVVEAGHAGSGR